MPGKEEQKAKHEATIKAAMEHVWADKDEFIRAISCYYAFTNMGQDLDTSHTMYTRVGSEQHLFASAWQRLVNDNGAEDGPDIEPERKSWVKTAKQIVAAMKKAKLPFTMQNAEKVFDDKSYGIKV